MTNKTPKQKIEEMEKIISDNIKEAKRDSIPRPYGVYHNGVDIFLKGYKEALADVRELINKSVEKADERQRNGEGVTFGFELAKEILEELK